VWLDHLELAHLAVGVGEPNDFFFAINRGMARLLAQAGFPDVPLAYSAIQNYTMGCVQVAANRRLASHYFRRDPGEAELRSVQGAKDRGADEDMLGVIRARFDDGDELHFEPGLRALMAGLLGARA
jgi:hypothetical protein